MIPKPLPFDEVVGALVGFAEAEYVRGNRIRVKTTVEHLRDVLGRAKAGLRCDHLIQIATVDRGTAFELVYHLTGEHRVVISVVIGVAREPARVPSVHDLFPPAAIYERQIHDLFGIVFEGHPNLARIILNEDWPEGEYPLRKDWKMDPAKAYGGPPPEVE